MFKEDQLRFNYPINVICFNRPKYLHQLLKSLKNQSIECPEEQLFFWVDGYSGSKDEMLGMPDQTAESVAKIMQFFPRSHVKVSSENLGIARNYWRAEQNSFENLAASSAFFLEEDLVLSPLYFELTMKMDSLFSFDRVISHFSPTGDVAHATSVPKDYFQAFGHNWGYLMRGWHHFERRELLKEYIEIISMRPYYLRYEIQSQIFEHFYNKGIILAGTSQDAIKDGLRNYFGRASVTTLDPWASNVGVLGEHFQSETPHHNRVITTDLASFPNYFDPIQNSRLVLDGKRKTISQVYQNYLAHFISLLGERDALLGERDALLGERDALLGERDSAIAELSLIRASTIWRLFFPYRRVVSMITRHPKPL
jgi:hypothetical protein